MNWDYWMNSGEWFPWGMRAFVIGVLAYLAFSPEFTIRVRDKLFPRWPDGTPQGFGFFFGRWKAGIEFWWEARRVKRDKKHHWGGKLGESPARDDQAWQGE